MTSDEIGNLTLAELEAIAARFEAAVKTIREAQSMLGQPVLHNAYAIAPPAPVARDTRRSTKATQLTDEEIAEREALLAHTRGPARNESEFPPNIAAALGGT